MLQTGELRRQVFNYIYVWCNACFLLGRGIPVICIRIQTRRAWVFGTLSSKKRSRTRHGNEIRSNNGTRDPHCRVTLNFIDLCNKMNESLKKHNSIFWEKMIDEEMNFAHVSNARQN